MPASAFGPVTAEYRGIYILIEPADESAAVLTVYFGSTWRGREVIENAVLDKDEFLAAPIGRRSPGTVAEVVPSATPSRPVIDTHSLDVDRDVPPAVIHHAVDPTGEPYPDLVELIKVAMVYPD
jgi:hypothetical protein